LKGNNYGLESCVRDKKYDTFLTFCQIKNQEFDFPDYNLLLFKKKTETKLAIIIRPPFSINKNGIPNLTAIKPLTKNPRNSPILARDM